MDAGYDPDYNPSDLVIWRDRVLVVLLIVPVGILDLIGSVIIGRSPLDAWVERRQRRRLAERQGR